MAVINTETGLPLLLATIVQGLPHGLGRSSIIPHSNISLTHLSITSEVRGLGRYGGRSTGRVPSGTGNVASAIVQRPNSDIDREKTGRYLAHKSRTASFCSTVNVELANALDRGPSRSDLARRTSSSETGVFATALIFNWSGVTTDAVYKLPRCKPGKRQTPSPDGLHICTTTEPSEALHVAEVRAPRMFLKGSSVAPSENPSRLQCEV